MARFTIRDVLWLTVVVALGLVWWLDHRSLAPDALTAHSKGCSGLGLCHQQLAADWQCPRRCRAEFPHGSKFDHSSRLSRLGEEPISPLRPAIPAA